MVPDDLSPIVISVPYSRHLKFRGNDIELYNEGHNEISSGDVMASRSAFLNLLLLVARLWACRICMSPTFVNAVTYKKKLLSVHIVHLYIIIYLYFIVFKYFVRYNTLFTYTSKSIVLRIGIIFSVFLGPNEHLQVFEYPVAVWSVTSEDHLSSQHQNSYVSILLRANVAQLKPNSLEITDIHVYGKCSS
jgi:hypothetical protein